MSQIDPRDRVLKDEIVAHRTYITGRRESQAPDRIASQIETLLRGALEHPWQEQYVVKVTVKCLVDIRR